MEAVKPWTNPQTVAVLWLIAGCIALGWIAGLVAEYQERLQWSYVRDPVTRRDCPMFARAACR